MRAYLVVMSWNVCAGIPGSTVNDLERLLCCVVANHPDCGAVQFDSRTSARVIAQLTARGKHFDLSGRYGIYFFAVQQHFSSTLPVCLQTSLPSFCSQQYALISFLRRCKELWLSRIR